MSAIYGVVEPLFSMLNMHALCTYVHNSPSRQKSEKPVMCTYVHNKIHRGLDRGDDDVPCGTGQDTGTTDSGDSDGTDG